MIHALLHSCLLLLAPHRHSTNHEEEEEHERHVLARRDPVDD